MSSVGMVDALLFVSRLKGYLQDESYGKLDWMGISQALPVQINQTRLHLVTIQLCFARRNI